MSGGLFEPPGRGENGPGILDPLGQMLGLGPETRGNAAGGKKERWDPVGAGQAALARRSFSSARICWAKAGVMGYSFKSTTAAISSRKG